MECRECMHEADSCSCGAGVLSLRQGGLAVLIFLLMY